MNTGQIQSVRTKLHWKYRYLGDVIFVGSKPTNRIPRVTKSRFRLSASSNFQRDLFRKSWFSLVYDWQMGLRGKRTPVSGSQSWITFGLSKSAMGSGLFDVLFRPISEVRTYKQVSKQIIYFYGTLPCEKQNYECLRNHASYPLGTIYLSILFIAFEKNSARLRLNIIVARGTNSPGALASFSRILLEGAYLCDIDFYRSEGDRSNFQVVKWRPDPVSTQQTTL